VAAKFAVLEVQSTSPRVLGWRSVAPAYIQAGEIDAAVSISIDSTAVEIDTPVPLLKDELRPRRPPRRPAWS
jgi:hypothetical protein